MLYTIMFCILLIPLFIRNFDNAHNILSDTLKSYYYQADDVHSLSQNYITSITVAANDLLLVGTLWGINVYNPAQDAFDRIQHDDSSLNVFNLNSNFINTLYSDSQNRNRQIYNHI